MKPVLFFVLTFLTAAAVPGPQARAESLFYDKCETAAMINGATVQLAAYTTTAGGFAGLSCQDLKSTLEAMNILSITLMPVSVALSAPGAREMILADLAAYGLTLANPAVLGVTVIGAVGVVTVYFVMKASLDECERAEKAQLRDEIVRQVKESFGAQASPSVPLEIRK